MTTAKQILESGSFTELERKAIIEANEVIQNNFGEGWSPLEVSDIAKACAITVNAAKGVIGSLVKKNILEVCDDFGMISFKNQRDMTYEKIV